jgi:hypothetical protein
MSPPVFINKFKILGPYLIILILLFSSISIFTAAEQEFTSTGNRGLPRPGQKEVEVIKEVDVAPGGGYWQGSVSTPMILFGMRSKQTAEFVNWINVTHRGNGDHYDITKITLFENTNINDHFEPGIYDLEITSCSNWTDEGYMNIPFTDTMVPTGGQGLQIWVACDFAGTALGTHGVEITYETDIQGPGITVIDTVPPKFPLQSSIIGINLTSDYNFGTHWIDTFDMMGQQQTGFYSADTLQIVCNVSHTWGQDNIYSANITVKNVNNVIIESHKSMQLVPQKVGPTWKTFKYVLYLPNPSPRGSYTSEVKAVGRGKLGVIIINKTSDTFNVLNKPPEIIGVIPDQHRNEDESWQLTLGQNKNDLEDANDDLNWSVKSIESPIDHVDVTDDILTFYLKKDKFGNDRIEIHLKDTDGDSTWTTIWVNISSVNDETEITPPIPNQTKKEDDPDWTVDLSGHMYDAEDPNSKLKWSIWSVNEDLYSAEIEGNFLRFSLVPDAFGEDILYVNLTDTDDMSTTQEVKVTIEPVNDEPIWKPIDTIIARKMEIQDALNFEDYIEDIDTEDYMLEFDISYDNMDKIELDIDDNNYLDIYLKSADYTCLTNVVVSVFDGTNFVQNNFKIFATVEHLVTTLRTPPDKGVLSTKAPQLSWYATVPKAFQNYKVKYNLYFNKDILKVGNLNSSVLIKKDLTSESFILSSLNNGSKYYWTVIPILYDSSNEILLKGECESGVWEFLIDLSATNEPPLSYLMTPLNNTIIKETSVLLTWNGYDPNGDTPIFYELYFGKDRIGVAEHEESFEIKDLEKPTSTSYLATNLTEDKTYYWTVVPSDGKEDGICSENIWEFGININNVQPQTKLEYPENNAYVSTSPELYWTCYDPDAAENIKYFIYLSDDYRKVESFDGSVLYRNRGFFENYIQISPALEANILYYWTVIPEDNVGKGFCSSGIWSFTTSGISNFLPRVNLLTPKGGVTLGDTEVELTWKGTDENEGDVLSYMVYFSTNKELVEKYDFSALFETVTDGTSIKISYLQNDTTYYWAVIPYDGKNNGLCLEKYWSFKIDTSKPSEYSDDEIIDSSEEENSYGDLMNYILLSVIIIVIAILIGALVLRKSGKKKKSEEKKEERVEMDKEDDSDSKEPEPSPPEPPEVSLPEASTMLPTAKPLATTLAAEFPLEQAYRAPPGTAPKIIATPVMNNKVEPEEPEEEPLATPIAKPMALATPFLKVEASTLAMEYPLEQAYRPPPEVETEPEPEPTPKQEVETVTPAPEVKNAPKPKIKKSPKPRIKTKRKPKRVVKKSKTVPKVKNKE